tara:strand:+ start:501 stop:713 length:213 start_codon:yes stop_codon:yes gene_type:complete
MEEDISNVIVTLKKTLTKKYGKNFKKFYLLSEEDHSWVGLISLTSEEGERNSQYYNIKEDKVLLDEYQVS